MSEPTASTVVLVHGAFHGPWSFDRVLPRLADAGVAALAVDLPSSTGGPPGGGELAGDVAQVREVLDGVEGPVVLLGHSYGGAVVTDAGTHPAVRRLVFLCAFALAEGESCAAAAASDPAAARISHAGRPDLTMATDDDGRVTLDLAEAAACFYNGADEETTAWALSRLGSQPFATLTGSPTACAWRSVPSTYVVCTEDMTVHPDLQRIMAQRCTDVVEWPTGHSPMLTDPDRVAELLIGLVRS